MKPKNKHATHIGHPQERLPKRRSWKGRAGKTLAERLMALRQQPPLPPCSVQSPSGLLSARVSDDAIGGGVPLEHWLRNQAGEWALQFVRNVCLGEACNGPQLHFAAEWSFRAGTMLACQVIKRGGLDRSHGSLWKRLLMEARAEVGQFWEENAADRCAGNAPDSLQLPAEEYRRAAKTEILKAVHHWLGARVDEVFQMADGDGDPKPGTHITWGDLGEIRHTICNHIVSDLHKSLGQEVQDILETVLSGGGETDDASASVLD